MVRAHQTLLPRFPYTRGQALITLFLFVSGTGWPTWSQNAGDIFPDWALEDASHSTVQFYADTEAELSVLIFWASWCPFCRDFFPYLADIADKFSKKGVRFYAMNAWEREHDIVVEYLEEQTRKSPHIHLLLHAERIAPMVEVRAVPVLFVLNHQHEIVLRTAIGNESKALAKELEKTLTEELLALP